MRLLTACGVRIMRIPLALAITFLNPLIECGVRILHETRLLRVRTREVRDFVQERDVLLRQGGAIEVAHAGANVDEGRCEI